MERNMPKHRSAGRGPQNKLVAVIAYDGLCTFEYGIAVEVFGLRRPEISDWYTMITCAAEPGPLRAAGGLEITASRGLAALAQAGTVTMPGWRSSEEAPPAALVAALRSAARRGARIVSICTGAFVLAAAGLLEGKRATTHWRYIDALRRAYPHIELAPDVLYVDEGSVLTSAGSAAGIDLLLHIVRKDFGGQAANLVARALVMPAHREGGQRQLIERPVPRRTRGQLAPLLDEMRQRLDHPMPLAKLARRAAMSERTFLRRFKEATGASPAAWLVAERVAHARTLLERGALSVDEVAAAVGFGTAVSLRTHFRRHVGVGPSEYRRQFALKR